MALYEYLWISSNPIFVVVDEIKMAIKHGRDSLTMNIVLNALRSRELELKKNKGKEPEALWWLEAGTEKKSNKGGM